MVSPNNNGAYFHSHNRFHTENKHPYKILTYMGKYILYIFWFDFISHSSIFHLFKSCRIKHSQKASPGILLTYTAHSNPCTKMLLTYTIITANLCGLVGCLSTVCMDWFSFWLILQNQTLIWTIIGKCFSTSTT